MEKKKNVWRYNLIFIVICGGLFLFLWSAPPETTVHLPDDENHAPFTLTNKKPEDILGKKEAEKFCGECHGDDAQVPFPPNHPPKYRCLFCHKRQ